MQAEQYGTSIENYVEIEKRVKMRVAKEQAEADPLQEVDVRTLSQNELEVHLTNRGVSFEPWMSKTSLIYLLERSLMNSY